MNECVLFLDCAVGADVIFVLDDSGFIDEPFFVEMKNFVSDIVVNLDIENGTVLAEIDTENGTFLAERDTEEAQSWLY